MTILQSRDLTERMKSVQSAMKIFEDKVMKSNRKSINDLIAS